MATFPGTSGADTLVGTSGDDIFTVNHTGDVVQENPSGGTDLVNASISYTLTANVEKLTLTGATNLNATGNALDNTILGNTGANLLTGDAGNDSLSGGTGIDSYVGGVGDDTYVVDNSAEVITEGASGGTDVVLSSASYTLSANVEVLTLTGTSAINGTGSSDANTLNGNIGANMLNGGAGADTMVGGAGNDSYVVDAAGDVVTETATSVSEIDVVSSSIAYTLGANLEKLVLTGTAAINGVGNELNNTLTGNSAINTLTGGDGNDTYIVGAGDVVVETSTSATQIDEVQASASYTLGANVEKLVLTGSALNGTGNALNNTLTGNIAANRLDGGLGNDSMNGGAGNDIYYVNTTGDVVTEASTSATELDTVISSISYTLGVNVENLTLSGAAVATNAGGNSLANVLTGDFRNNKLDGGVGADSMTGGGGNDTYIVDNAGDVVTENGTLTTEIDTVQTALAYTLGANVENLVLTGTGAVAGVGNSLNNSLSGSLNSGANTLAGGAGNDTYTVGANDVITELAGEGTDTVMSAATYTLTANVENLALTGSVAANLTGNADNNTLTGNTANNKLDGGAGNDTMAGGVGNDTYIVDSISDVVTEANNQGTDVIESSVSFTLVGQFVEQLTLTGTADINATGNGLANKLTGNSGANRLDGGIGADIMMGGAGSDTYVVDISTDAVTESSTDPAEIDLVQSAISYTLGANLENLTLTGTAVINATGNTLANVLVGNSAANKLDGGTGADSMTGGVGNDTYIVDQSGDVVSEGASGGIDLVQSAVTFALGAELENLTLTGTAAINGTGNSVANVLTGNSGANVLDGGTGADSLIGGSGNDTYVVEDISDVITESSASSTEIDTVSASVDWTLGANLEKLVLMGGAINGVGNTLANTLTGNANDNKLDGSTGVDTLIGGSGNDTYVVDMSTDVVTEAVGEGTDIVLSSASYTLGDNIESLTLTGTSAINATGNALANTLMGNSAANKLDGGAGSDAMTGMAGNDTYVVDSASDVVTETLNEGTDLIQSSVSYIASANVESLTLTGTAAINAVGNALANTLTGNSAANILNGSTGNDTMIGGAGNDTYTVDSTADIVTETSTLATEVDVIQASVGYTLSANVEQLILIGAAVNGNGNTLANTLTGNSAGNKLDGGTGVDTLIGGDGNDTYIVDVSTDVVTEATGTTAGSSDLVQSSASYVLSANVEKLTLTGTAVSGTGNADNNTITGNGSNNVLDGGVGADTLVGGTGLDSYVVDNAGDVVTETSTAAIEVDQVSASVSYALSANVEKLVLTGTADINGTGNGLANTLMGNSGANSLNGGAGIDTMIGGAGNDTYIVDVSTDVATETVGEGTDSVLSGVSYTLGANIENLTLTGTASTTGTGNTLANTLTGNTGSNKLDGGAGADALVGGDGNDTYVVDNASDVVTETSTNVAQVDLIQSSVSYALGANVEKMVLTGTAAINATGNSLANVLTGNAAANLLDGGAGDDSFFGGAGNDTYIVDVAGDVVSENAGAGDDLVQSAVSYALTANVERLTLTGTAANATGNTLANTLVGNASANMLNGGTGIDTMSGGAGDDTYIVDVATDVVSETVAEGTDLVQSNVSYTLTANVENLTLTGTAAINAGGNSLNNILMGNSGANKLDGSTGTDAMTGGDGNDTYVVDAAGDTVTETSAVVTQVDLVQASVSFALSNNVEQLTLTGTAAINATGNSLDNLLTGNTAANTLDGGAGNDIMVGGNGNDTYMVDAAADVVTEITGTTAGVNDLVVASVSYTLSNDVESLTLASTAGAINGAGNTLTNTLTGNTAANMLDGGAGVDTLIGGAGNDTYVVDVTGDVITETSTLGSEIDVVMSSATYVLGANLETLVLTGTASINGTGNSLANTLTGNSNGNVLDGGTGADAMTGGTGNDTYVVDAAGDVVTETSTNAAEHDVVQASVSYALSANVETLILTGTAASAVGNASANTLTGNASANTLDGGLGTDSMNGGAGNDTYVVDSASDVVTETSTSLTELDWVMSAVNYTLGSNVERLTLTGTVATHAVGNALANILNGNSLANTIDGSTGVDTMAGGAGNDTYLVDVTGDVITETVTSASEVDQVLSSASYTLGTNVENLTLMGAASINGTGNGSDNVIIGNGGVNNLKGLSGNDYLDGGTGVDTLIGGLGNDTYVVDIAGDVVTEAASEGTDVVVSSVGYTLGADVEHLVLTGTSALNGVGNALNNSITGNAGANRINGGAGVDTMVGGAGNDSYVVDSTTDVITEAVSGGTDTVESGVTYTLGAELENLTLTGTANSQAFGNAMVNTLMGNSGANLLNGGTEADIMMGGAGNDTYVVDDAADFVSESASGGTDLVQSSVTFTLMAEVENLTLTGSANINATGTDVANTLIGNAGSNLINGGFENDILQGGAGNDTYLLNVSYATETITETAGNGTDTVVIGTSVDIDQIWFNRLGSSRDLEVTIIGTTDVAVIKDWFVSTSSTDHTAGSSVEVFANTDTGKTLSETNVKALVDAMASLTKPPLGQFELDSGQHTALDSLIGAKWV